MITSIKHVMIPVKDQDKALEFYTEKLGFKVEVDVPAPTGQRWIELEIPGSQTRVVLFNGEDLKVGTHSAIIFTSDDIPKTYRELHAKGVEFVMVPKEEPWGTFATFKDVDGNIFCISST